MIREFVLLLLRGYKWLISPMLPTACRFVPTCSEYAAEAVARYGAVRGILMAVWRLLRCHPFSQGGYDPVVKNPVVPNDRAELPVHVCDHELTHPAATLFSHAPATIEIHHSSGRQSWRC